MKGKTKRRAAVSLAVLMVFSLSGCGRNTPGKILDEMVDHLAQIQSVASTIKVEIQIENASNVTEMSLDMSLENTKDPEASHAKATAEVSVRGRDLSSDLETYQVREDGQDVSYNYSDDSWTKEIIDPDENTDLLDESSIFQAMTENSGSFRLADETVDFNGQECYQLYGEIRGKELTRLFGEDVLSAYGFFSSPDEGELDDLMFPITLEVYQEDLLPARIVSDLTDSLSEVFEDETRQGQINDFSISMTFDHYDQVEPIEVPEKVKEAL